MKPRRFYNKAPKKQGRAAAFFQAVKTVNAKCVIVVVLGTALLTFMFCAAITPERYDLKVGDIAPKTISASKEVEDVVTTARNRENAAKAVESSYKPEEGVLEEVMEDLNRVFDQLRQIREYGESVIEQSEEGAQHKFTEAELLVAKAFLTDLTLTDYQLPYLLSATAEEFENTYKHTRDTVRNTMNTTVRQGQITESLRSMRDMILAKADTNLVQNVVYPVLRLVVKPNMVVDEESTEINREKARAAVEPVIYNQGQNIIRAGDRVELYQLEMIRALGLLDDKSVDIPMYAGSALLIAISILFALVFLHLMHAPVVKSHRDLMVMMIVLNITLLVCILVQSISASGDREQYLYHLMPVSMGALLLTGLLGPVAGLGGNFAIGIIASALTAGGNAMYGTDMVHILLAAIIGGTVGAFTLRIAPQRARILLCGLYVAVVNMLVMLAIGLMTSNDLHVVLNNALLSGAGALIASMLSLGLQPLFEAVFNLATPSKLMELSNPNQPLLRRLLLEAPGTYHHSIIVANLAEAAAEAVGANPLLARAGAYFHDVGKLKRPTYFKENQMGENPHDHTDPYVSAAILGAHTRDGLTLAQRYRLPEEIQTIIMEHHGDTPTTYFYHKALQQSNGTPVDINDFRYDGTRPTMKESAIIMLADTVEAAVRAMPDPTPERMLAFIEQLVRGKIEDGQLSDSPLTLRDIDKICEAFSAVLNGVFHERIEYPTVNVRGRLVGQTPPQPTLEEAGEAEGDEQPAVEGESDQPEAPAMEMDATEAAPTEGSEASPGEEAVEAEGDEGQEDDAGEAATEDPAKGDDSEEAGE